MTDYISTVQPSETLTLAQAIEFVLNKKFMDYYCLSIGKVTAVNGNNLTIHGMINFKLADGSSQTPPLIYNVPFGIMQGGNSAFITEYAEKDIVLVGFIDREYNALKKDNTTASTPALLRMHNIGDAFVICNWGNGKAPTTYVKVTDSNGVEIVSSGSNKVTINSGGNTEINATGDVKVTGNNVNVTANGQANINSNNINLGGSAGAYVLTTNTVITAPSGGGPCGVTIPSTTTKAV